jgi:hypothetical protein
MPKYIVDVKYIVDAKNETDAESTIEAITLYGRDFHDLGESIRVFDVGQAYDLNKAEKNPASN